MSTLDDIAPDYLRDSRIDLSLDPSVTVLRSFSPILVNVSYTRTDPQGVVPPLVLEVQGPSYASYQRKEFLGALPVQVSFTPREGGMHVVTLREAAHNYWWGSLTLTIAGDSLEQPRAV